MPAPNLPPALTVILCAHNPDRQSLTRTLEALAAQTLPKDTWELVFVDNASKTLLSNTIDLSWHPQSRHVQEQKLGLTYARLQGIQQANADVLVFVDDDNVLAEDYLEVAYRISKEWTVLGAWGGQIDPEFVVTPPDWTKPYWRLLAVREVKADRWSNLKQDRQTVPYGAGMCIRKFVAEKYANRVQTDPRRMSLGRRGDLLTSSEDLDLAFTAPDMGLGMGLFAALRLTHLIPATRLEEAYLLRLMKGISYSNVVLDAVRGMPTSPGCLSLRLFNFYARLRMDARSRLFYDAAEAGKKLALEELANWKAKRSSTTSSYQS
jgi:glycosyltransferase involved in cell wall biosynthesis